MFRASSVRLAAATLVLALALNPVASLARAPAPAHPPASAPPVAALRGHRVARPQSAIGVVLAVACGASANIARIEPIPIVLVVGAAACLTMLMDAWLTPDG